MPKWRKAAGDTTSTSTPSLRTASTAAATKTPDTWRSSRGYDVVRTQTRISDVRRRASSVLRRRQLQLVRRLVLQRKLEPANSDEHAFEEPAIRCQEVAEDADHDDLESADRKDGAEDQGLDVPSAVPGLVVVEKPPEDRERAE